MAKKIAIDLSYITVNFNKGVDKYGLRIIDYIVNHNLQDKYLLIVNYIAEKRMQKLYPDFEMVILGKSWMDKTGYFKFFFFAYDFKQLMKRVDVNLVFCPYGNPINCLIIQQKKIATLHDMQVRIDKEARKFRDVWLYTTAEDKLAKDCVSIFTISNFSRTQILNYYPQIASKLFNMSNLVSIVNDESLKPMDIGTKYLLYVGRLDIMKNVITLVKSFVELKHNNPELKLVLVTNSWGYYEREILPIVESNSLNDSIMLIKNCSEEDLARWYMGAELFVFPSLREGFGFPPIEAAMYGTQVVTSKADSLEEVTLGLLTYYEPATDVQSLTNAISTRLDNPLRGTELSAIKEEFNKRYSIDVVAKNICTKLDSYNN